MLRSPVSPFVTCHPGRAKQLPFLLFCSVAFAMFLATTTCTNLSRKREAKLIMSFFFHGLFVRLFRDALLTFIPT